MDIISVENLSFDYVSYDDEGKETERCRVLKNVSLTVPEGQFAENPPLPSTSTRYSPRPRGALR